MKHFIYILIAALAFSSCTNQFTVNGKIEQMPAQKFRLEELAIDGNIFVDSGMTKPDGSFTFNAKAEEETLYRLKFMQGKYILLALKNGDKATINGNWNALEDYTVSGSRGSLALKGFLVNLRENIRDMRTMEVILDSLKNTTGQDSMQRSAEQDLVQIKQQFLGYVKKFADTTQSLAASLFAVNIINPRREGDYVKTYYEGITKRFPKSKTARAFADRYLKTAPKSTPSDAPSDLKTAPDFSAATPEGALVSLNSMRGKFVLVDFWASWCGPCRAENPNVVEAYKKFNGRNFTILGVSLDTDKNKWRKAIAEDGLSWTHVSELAGWNSVIARQYAVESIPQNFLIGPEGHIIASGLRGQELMQKLDQVLPPAQ